MNRAFTNREKILMVILAVILLGCVYYLAVYSPSVQAKESADAQVSQLESDIAIQQAMQTQKDSMQSELKELKAQGMKKKTTLEYDSSAKIMSALNAVLSSTKSYQLSFDNPTQSEDGAAMRHTASVSFTAGSYSEARNIIKRLSDFSYSSLVTDFSIVEPSKDSSTKEVSGSATIVFYESL